MRFCSGRRGSLRIGRDGGARAPPRRRRIRRVVAESGHEGSRADRPTPALIARTPAHPPARSAARSFTRTSARLPARSPALQLGCPLVHPHFRSAARSFTRTSLGCRSFTLPLGPLVHHFPLGTARSPASPPGRRRRTAGGLGQLQYAGAADLSRSRGMVAEPDTRSGYRTWPGCRAGVGDASIATASGHGWLRT